MGWDSRPAGGWLLGTGIVLGGSYLIATVSVGGRHPVWPYFLFGAMAGAGLVLYFAGGRGQRTGAPGSDRARRLALLGAHLRAFATGRGLTVDDVRTRVTGTWTADDAEQYLAGTSWPEWPFVQAFAKVVAVSKWHRVDIERELHPLWMAAAPETRRKMSRAARRAITVIAAVTSLAAVGVIIVVVQPPQRGQASPPVCNPPPPGLGAQQIYCDDFRSDANDWEDPNAPRSGDGVYRLGAYSLKAAAGGDVQVGAPQQAKLGLYASVNVLVSVLATAAPVPGAQYGLTCRGGPDEQLHLQGKGYAFVIAGSIAVIEKVEFRGGPTQVYGLAASQHALPVRHGASLLQASCETRTLGAKTAVLLRFWVNGEQVASYEDLATPFTTGYVGVVCLTNGSAPQPVTATFERFGVYSLQAPATATPSSAVGTRPGQSSQSATRTPAAAAGTPPAAPITVPATVYASQLQPQPVQNLTITKGDLVSITAISGLWQCADQTGKTSIGGSPAYDKVATNRQWAVPSAPFCSLIARIDGGPWLGLAPTFQFVADNSGPLELTANDLMPANCPQPPARTSCYTDNSGAITVRITVSAG
jgi:hypothetical protein